ncbi:MAG: SH3 domain-containing protein [Dehalococcoidia bacterium]|nr:SH3 domain-containing protein [Dehalococcoidia bacterium]
MLRPVFVHRVLAAAVLMLALAATGCGGDGEDPPATAGPASPTAAGTSADADETPTPTPTEAGAPVSSLETVTGTITTEDLNVRTGPGTTHPVIGRLQPGDEVPVAGYSAAGTTWLGLPGIGWTAYAAEWIELPVEAGTLPDVAAPELRWEFVGPVHAPGTASGLPIVDEVVVAIEQHDRAALLALAGGGEAEGSGEPSDTCGVLPASMLEEHLDQFLRSEVAGQRGGSETALRLYAIVRAPASGNADPDYVVVFAFEGGEGRQVWVAPDGSITGFAMGCEPALPGDMLRVSEGEPFFWFRPPVPEPLDPVE